MRPPEAFARGWQRRRTREQSPRVLTAVPSSGASCRLQAIRGECGIHLAVGGDRLVDRDFAEAHRVADWTELADLPEGGVDDGAGDDEAARGRPVRPRGPRQGT